MKHLLIFLSFIAFSSNLCFSQETKDSVHIYNPKANAAQDIKDAVATAGKEHKHVLLQIGGNWCIWCRRFNQLVTTDPDLSKLLADDYIVIHINYSPDERNLDVMASLDYPQRFGFPVFVVLNGKGERIHTQNSAYLEDGPGHSKKKVQDFLTQWSPAALDPSKYINK